jgi:hypothetical protein
LRLDYWPHPGVGGREISITDTTKATAAATSREFIKSGGTLGRWLQVYGYVASQLSDGDLALSKLNSGELADVMRRELARLTCLKQLPKSRRMKQSGRQMKQ